jgi:hypothetical protein
MKEAVHVDFATGTTRSTVIFGTISAAPFEARRALEELAKRKVARVSYHMESMTGDDVNTLIEYCGSSKEERTRIRAVYRDSSYLYE